MPKQHRTMDDARELLFDAAEKLKNAKSDELDAELLRAKGIGSLVGVIVESAKVEVMHTKATGQASGSGFLPAGPRELPEGKQPASPRLVGDGRK